MSIVQSPDVLKQRIQEIVGQVDAFVQQAAREGTAIHQVERGIWDNLLDIGQQFLTLFLSLQGDGDRGETIAAADGGEWQRLAEPHPRRYVSIFGVFNIDRFVYGTREGQKIEFVPLDARLQLPASVYSYVLQDWSQGLCVESAFSPVTKTLQRLLRLDVGVDGLERTNVQLAEQVDHFRDQRPMPTAAEEGAVFVASADGKGIVMRRSAADPAPASHRTKGKKASQKRMATVATVYSVDRYVRTPEEVVAALFRDARDGPPPPRPKPQHKQVWASLSCVEGDQVLSSMDKVHEEMMEELIQRNRQDHHWQRPMVFLYDGQEALWEARDRHLPASGVNIVDLLHVTPRLWQAAHVFHAEGSDAAEAFVRERCLRVLKGQVAGVIRGLREMATKQGLKANKKKTITQICNYLANNQERMHYDAYLSQGYPIASGVIEGACRHLVKDRMERAGMHWTPAGAQAMLDVRSVYVNDEWDAYQEYRIEREQAMLYPKCALAAEPQLDMGA